MRGKSTFGRFSALYEIESVGSGVENDLQEPMGQKVRWWTYNSEASEVDPVYSVGANVGTGRMWNVPFSMSVVMATITQGPLYQNDRGFYTLDNLILVVNATEMYDKLPDMAYGPDPHLKDRIEYRGHAFTPTLIYPKGHIQNHLVVVRIEALEVKPEELVNDVQFNHLATPVVRQFTDEFTNELTPVHKADMTEEFDQDDFYVGVSRKPPSKVGVDQNSWPRSTTS
jgi:hypothetical protein